MARVLPVARPRPRRRQRVRIALLGTRGIPANYGGFETFAEELSTRLAARGHEVTVYCRERHPEPVYRGVRLRYLPTIRHKYFDTLAHTFLSTLHLLAHRVGRRALLQRRERHLHARCRGRRHAGGAERRRHRAQAQEVEPRWPRLVSAVRVAGDVLPDVVVTDARRHPAVLPANATGKTRASSPTARRSGKVADRGRRCATSASKPGAIFSMSAAWSRRTTRWRCARRSSSVARPI